jgi:hypothetical protein
MAAEVASYGVDVDRNGFFAANPRKLGLLEPRGDAEVVDVDQGHQALTGLDMLAEFDSTLADDAIGGSDDPDVAQIQNGLFSLPRHLHC